MTKHRILIFVAAAALSLILGSQAAFTAAPDGSRVFLNQAGYLPDAAKVAICDREAKSFLVRNEADQSVALKGTLVPFSDPTSKKKIWRADFSKLTAEGTYRVEVAGIGRSYPFAVGQAVYNRVLELGMRSYYLQRCGVALNDPVSGLSHPVCHLNDGILARADAFNPKDASIPSRGGWHDAGDYGKYTTTITVAAGQMLAMYALWPEKFTDGQYRLPESGNGLPDLLDETSFGLDWLLTMQRSDGAVYHKLSGASWPPFTTPEMDRQPRYIYGISSADTAKFAAVMAMAARVYKELRPEFADRAKLAAEKAWSFLKANPGFVWDYSDFDSNGSGAYGSSNDKADRLWAALEMAVTEGWPLEASWVQALQAYTPTAISWEDAALLGLYDAAACGSLAADVRETAAQKLQALAERYCKAAKSSGYGYSLMFSEFAWASNKTGLARGITLILADRLKPNPAYRQYALAQLNFVLGGNPLSICFLTGLGAKPADSPHHRFSAGAGKTVPGLLVGGPNNKSESGVEPPNQGPYSYSDYQASYSSNEPAIDYNAALVFAAAAFAAAQARP